MSTERFRIGFLPLVDAALPILAHELGFAEAEGVAIELVRDVTWATVRDRLLYGHTDAAHMVAPLAIASALGRDRPPTAMTVPFVLGLNGNAITFSTALGKACGLGETLGDPFAVGAALRAVLQTRRLRFGVVHRHSSHNYMLRYWLAGVGIRPDVDIEIVVTSPPFAADALASGEVDGICVGEPWNYRAIKDGIGHTAITTQQMWRDHPEKVCAFTEEFAGRNPKTVKAILKALQLSSVYIDKMENRPNVADIVSRPTYINCPKDIILARLLGQYDYGDGRVEQDPNYMIFSQRACNYPAKTFGLWWMSQFRRWGMVKSSPDYKGVVNRVMRGDIYAEAMKEMGVTAPMPDMQPVKLFDGTFDPKDPEKYAKSFPIHSVSA